MILRTNNSYEIRAAVCRALFRRRIPLTPPIHGGVNQIYWEGHNANCPMRTEATLIKSDLAADAHRGGAFEAYHRAVKRPLFT